MNVVNAIVAELDKGSTRTQAEDEHLDSLLVRARYFYPAELWHGWAENLMLFSTSADKLVKYCATKAIKLYKSAEQDNRFFMASEYFWMRHLQVKLIVGEQIKYEEVLLKLREIKYFFCDLNDNSHISTLFMTRAFVEKYLTANEKAVIRCLNIAEKNIKKGGNANLGSRIRIILYRRYLTGSLSFISVSWELLNIVSSQIKRLLNRLLKV